MRNVLPVAVGGLAGLLVASVVFSPPVFNVSVHYLTALFFPERITPEGLLEKHRSDEPLKVLIVPGHDADSWGADYRGIREADLTVEIGKELRALFAADPAFEVSITRENGMFTQEFASYFEEERSLIGEFRDYVRTVFRDALRRKMVVPKTDNYHGVASGADAQKLYGVNKWANENDVDVVLHLHFNDYARRRLDQPGRYSGFSIYVPESQLPNARASRAVAEAVAAALKTAAAPSNYPQERGVIVEDQELIAVGSNASLDAAALVIEYGYIYEPQFIDTARRHSTMRELALRTYEGVRDFAEGGVENIGE